MIPQVWPPYILIKTSNSEDTIKNNEKFIISFFISQLSILD